MERMARWARQTVMMNQRRVRGFCGFVGFRGLAGAGLLVAALAGCGSVVASSDPPAAPAAPAASTPAAAAVGCASVNQATAVNIRRMLRLQPVGADPISGATYRQTAQVRAFFGQLCAAVNHPVPVQVMHCPADIGTEYLGTFYDSSRVLATFIYFSSGCERVSVTVAGKTQTTMVYGRSAAAAPHLAADLSAIIGTHGPGLEQPQQPQGSVNPGGPNMPA
jgi:hypothetical protein